jgi:hypothetical protein
VRRDVATAARRACAPAALGIRAAPRPRPHAGRGAPSPRAHASRQLEVRLAARRRDRAVLAGCAPRTAGPTAALPPYARRPRASTTASISCRHPFVTRASAPIKTDPFSFPARHRPPPSRHCRPPVSSPPRPFSGATNPPGLLLGSHRSLRRHLLRDIALPLPGPQPAAGATAGRRRAPSPEASPLTPRSPPRPR